MPDSAYEKRLIEQLVNSGKLTREELEAGLEVQRQRGGPERVLLADVLVEQGLVSAADIQLAQPAPAAPARAAGVRGMLMGRFEIRDLLGRGGMGAVYRAFDPQLNREVAIKVTYAEASNDAARQLARFQREAEVIARLHHRGIVSIHEVGSYEGQPFIVMDLVDGSTLEELLATGPSPSIRELVEIIAQVADALHHAHGQGVIHRDVKPDNVMVDSSGRPQLMDFGVARDLGASEDLTATGEVIGTFYYLAPEQASNARVKAGPYTDVYALGATLYRAVAGRPPFDAETGIVILTKILREAPVPLRSLVVTVPADLETITLKCLEKKPEDRYSSAAAMADDLRRFLAGESIKARPRGPFERGLRWLRSSSGVVAAGVLGLAAVLTAGVAWREPAPGDANRQALADFRGLREAARREDASPVIPPAKVADEVAQEEAAARREELERGRFFAGIRKQGDMHNMMGISEVNEDEVFYVRMPSEMVSEDLSYLTTLRLLKRLNIGNTPLADEGMATLRTLTQLIDLNLSGTPITDAGVEHIAGMVKLKKLDLSATGITDEGLVHVGELLELVALDLDNTRITSTGLQHLQGLRSIVKLQLNGTRVGDEGLMYLKGLKQLKRLDLMGCPVSAAGVAAFQSALPGCAVRR